ncbi:MAG TPA: hypothetical protein VGF76_08940 [Polyangiaceae bacterium]
MLLPAAEEQLSREWLEELGERMEIRFNAVLVAGYAAALPNTYDVTAADLAQARSHSAED